MPTMHLNQRRADALRPRKPAYDIRNRDLRGFGIRVRPSGRTIWFVHVQCGGEHARRTAADTECGIRSEVACGTRAQRVRKSPAVIPRFRNPVPRFGGSVP